MGKERGKEGGGMFIFMKSYFEGFYLGGRKDDKLFFVKGLGFCKTFYEMLTALCYYVL